ncbi:MAG: gas vesicle protein [Candidatus Tectomicrobia bacterium]|nr:gas vesicle protein [Candidatus Tectomicrobia bacterium]
MQLREAGEAVRRALSEVLAKRGEIVTLRRTEEGWESHVEVVEENEYLKALGKHVVDRNYYVIELSEALEVVAYDRLAKKPPAREE